MLVLSRKKNQSIQIGNIVITVNQVKKNKVMLGIDAPNEVKILRGELALVDSEAVEYKSNFADQGAFGESGFLGPEPQVQAGQA